MSGSAGVLLSASSTIHAPGTLSLDERRAGGAWRTIHTWPWSTDSSAAGQVDHAPPATSQYRLRFVYAGRSAATSAAVTVRVRPVISVSSTSLRVRKGTAYRLRGHVSPVERGRKVTIWTNRGGGWHKVSNGAVFTLVARLVVHHAAVRHAAQGELRAAGAPGGQRRLPAAKAR